MKILGIDPGFALVGYGIIDKSSNGKCKLIDYGAISTSASTSFPYRLLEIEQELEKIIEKHKPDEIAIEELFFTKNITTGIPVAGARGVIILQALKKCSKLFEYSPTQIKQTITGCGRADKSQIQQMTKLLLGIGFIPKPDDAADALAVALCHAQTNNRLSDNSMFKKLARGQNNVLKTRSKTPKK